MADRWTCQECSTRNEGINYSCQRCGQVRGLEAATLEVDSPEVGPDTPVPQGKSRSGFRFPVWLRVALILAAVGFFAVPFFTDTRRDNTGTITRGGDLSVHDLRVGDCFDIPDETAAEIETVSARPCSDPHDYEVFALHELPPVSFPSDSQFDSILESYCLPDFEPYVGRDYASSAIWVEMVVPTAQGWSDGDRAITCFVFDPDSKLTGSVRGSGR